MIVEALYYAWKTLNRVNRESKKESRKSLSLHKEPIGSISFPQSTHLPPRRIRFLVHNSKQRAAGLSKLVRNYIYIYIHVTECIVCVQGHDPLTFSFLSFFFFDWVGVLWPQLSKVLKLVRWASSVPFPQCPCRGRLFAVAAGVHVFISGESLHCFLVGVNKSYVIATSD